MIEISASRLCLVFAISCSLSAMSGPWVSVSLLISEQSRRVVAEKLLAESIDKLSEARIDLERAAVELHRADRVCSIWRETSSWYQGAFMRCVGKGSGPATIGDSKKNRTGIDGDKTYVHREMAHR